MARFDSALLIAAAWTALVLPAAALRGQSALPGPETGPAAIASAQGPTNAPWYEGFEGKNPTWRASGGDAQYRIDSQQRVAGEAHTGERCERLTIQATDGTSVYISHDVGHAQVIDELLPTLWIKSDRSGLQMLGEVVLPRTIDPHTGRPVFALIPGTSYTRVGAWQQLRIDQIPHQLVRQVRALRAELGPQVDEREAYLNRVVLNVYGGPGVTNVWIDDLDIAGYVARPAGAEGQTRPMAARPSRAAPVWLASQSREGPTAAAAANPPGRAVPRIKVQLAGSALLVEDRPIFPRIVQYQGEPLEFLSRLGFHGVWLDRPPWGELLTEAEQAQMWIVCPPPGPAGPPGSAGSPGANSAEGSAAVGADFGPQYNRVLVWDLGHGLAGGEQLEATVRWAEQIRGASRSQSRPLIGQPECNLKSYSRHLDLLLLARQPVGSSLELTDYGTWVRGRPLLAQPGMPIWTSIQTQLAPAVVDALRVLDPQRPPPTAIPGEQIRLLVYMAIAGGSRGLFFESRSPLNAENEENRQRATALRLVNLELSVIEPWVAAGTLMANVSGSAPDVAGALLQLDRARMLLPIWSAPGAQYAPGQSAGNSVSLIVPAPESCEAYEIVPGSLRPLPRKQVVGGMQVTLDEFGLAAMVLLAQDPAVISTMTQHAYRVGPGMAELQRALAAARLQSVPQVTAQIASRVRTPRQAAEWLRIAQQNMRTCDGQLAARDYQGAYLSAQRAMRALRLIERAYWEASIAKLPTPVFDAGTVSFATLPWHWKLMDRIGAAPRGPNLLPGGDFEDLGVTLQAGWQHFPHQCEGVQTWADLIPAAAHSGRLGLRLSVRPENPHNPPAMMEVAPLCITSPAVPVQAGDVVCIHGWVKIPAPLAASVDGLLVFDSLSGEALAERIGQTRQWREFTLYRTAAASGAVNVTFALTGLGEAFLDDVTIQVLQPAGAPGVTQHPWFHWPTR